MTVASPVVGTRVKRKQVEKYTWVVLDCVQNKETGEYDQFEEREEEFIVEVEVGESDARDVLNASRGELFGQIQEAKRKSEQALNEMKAKTAQLQEELR